MNILERDICDLGGRASQGDVIAGFKLVLELLRTAAFGTASVSLLLSIKAALLSTAPFLAPFVAPAIMIRLMKAIMEKYSKLNKNDRRLIASFIGWFQGDVVIIDLLDDISDAEDELDEFTENLGFYQEDLNSYEKDEFEDYDLSEDNLNEDVHYPHNSYLEKRFGYYSKGFHLNRSSSIENKIRVKKRVKNIISILTKVPTKEINKNDPIDYYIDLEDESNLSKLKREIKNEFDIKIKKIIFDGANMSKMSLT